MTLPFVSIPTSSAGALQHHTSSVIFLHGLGDSGHGWAAQAQALARQFPRTRFILPHA